VTVRTPPPHRFAQIAAFTILAALCASAPVSFALTAWTLASIRAERDAWRDVAHVLLGKVQAMRDCGDATDNDTLDGATVASLPRSLVTFARTPHPGATP